MVAIAVCEDEDEIVACGERRAPPGLDHRGRTLGMQAGEEHGVQAADVDGHEIVARTLVPRRELLRDRGQRTRREGARHMVDGHVGAKA